jgi:hypothetical protein
MDETPTLEAEAMKHFLELHCGMHAENEPMRTVLVVVARPAKPPNSASKLRQNGRWRIG